LVIFITAYYYRAAILVVMTAESSPNFTENTHVPAFFAPKAFSMFHEVATGIHHDYEVLGALALEAEAEFGQSYGLKAPIENTVLTYRFGSVGPGQPKAEAHIKRAASDAPYYNEAQLSVIGDIKTEPDNFAITSKERITALGEPFDIWTGREVSPPLLRRYLEALLYPAPANESPMALAEAWVSELESMASVFKLRQRVTPRRCEAFIRSSLAKHSDAIQLELR
jgi:hypothetical protein